MKIRCKQVEISLTITRHDKYQIYIEVTCAALKYYNFLWTHALTSWTFWDTVLFVMVTIFVMDTLQYEKIFIVDHFSQRINICETLYISVLLSYTQKHGFMSNFLNFSCMKTTIWTGFKIQCTNALQHENPFIYKMVCIFWVIGVYVRKRWRNTLSKINIWGKKVTFKTKLGFRLSCEHTSIHVAYTEQLFIIFQNCCCGYFCICMKGRTIQSVRQLVWKRGI